MTDLIGQHLGQYEIIGLLGRGGMAAVYRAHQPSMGRDVAIKVIKSELSEAPDFVERFAREARTVASLSHPHILKVFDYGQHGNLVYLVMELLGGGSLAQRISQGPIPPKTIRRMLDQMAAALDYAHERAIVHRDLKPQNVLLDERGNVFLTDFGIAKLLNEVSSLTQTGAAMGTPPYMAPEQWRGQAVEARTDNYSLGVMLFEMLTGNLPFRGETPYSVMHKHIYESPPLDEIAALGIHGVEQVLRKALAKDPSDRYESATAMAEAFSKTLSATQIRKKSRSNVSTPETDKSTYIPLEASAPSEPITRPPTGLRGNRMLLGAGAAVIGLIVIGGIVALFASRQTTTPTLAAQVGTDAAFTPIIATTQTSSPPTVTPPAPTVTSAATAFTPSATPNQAATLGAIVSASETALAASLTKTPTSTLTLTQSPTPTLTATQPPSATSSPTATIQPSATATTPPVPTVTLAVNPGSGKVAFTTLVRGRFAIFVVGLDGSDPQPFVSGNTNDFGAVWSPDGQQIAFKSDRDRNWDLYAMDASGANVRRLTNDPGHDETPAWSPDGKRIAFATKRHGQEEIYVMNADGSDQRNLTNHNAEDIVPTWSPDGKSIAFSSNRGGNYDVYVMDADGGNVRNLTNNRGDDGTPMWSPDGKSIVFYSTRDGNFEIYAMDADGGNQRNLTNNRANDIQPAWSPDSQQIAFVSRRDGSLELYAMNADGSNVRRLTNNNSDDYAPFWLP
jgi:Tol biopolymer transport system component/predicted Ser/Thr protein kinase